MISVEGHAAHCRMASTTIRIRVMKRQDRRTQHEMRMSGCPRYDGATSYRRREPRLDGFLYSNFEASVLKAWFLMADTDCRINQSFFFQVGYV